MTDIELFTPPDDDDPVAAFFVAWRQSNEHMEDDS